MSYNKIILKNYSDVFEEYLAGGTILPGMLLEINSDGEVVAHSDDAPAKGTTLIAIEDALQGKGIDDAYAEGDVVRVWSPMPGDVAYMILANGEDVAVGDFLGSDGAGALQEFNSSGVTVGIALEAHDLSGSTGEEDSSDAVLGTNRRIQVRIA